MSIEVLQGKRYRYVLDKVRGEAIEFWAAEDVFFPTQTSQLLIQGARQTITTPGKLLDVGCGIGVCGVVLAKVGRCHPPVYFSDVSAKATELAARNAQASGVEAIVRHGSLFAPWVGERFDVIVDDISGVCEDVAKLSRWFPDEASCQSGPDGTALVVRMLEQAPDHLNPEGVLVFPVLSLSREERILEVARRIFQEVSLVVEQPWFLPDELQQRFDVLQPLLEAGAIRLEHKFGTWLWSTKIYRARVPRRTETSPDERR